MQAREADLYLDKAERYLEEGKEISKSYPYVELHQQHAQTYLLGSIAASLIALAKK